MIHFLREECEIKGGGEKINGGGLQKRKGGGGGGAFKKGGNIPHFPPVAKTLYKVEPPIKNTPNKNTSL